LQEKSVGWFGHLFVAKRLGCIEPGPKSCPP
jgi:hypothetical protein